MLGRMLGLRKKNGKKAGKTRLKAGSRFKHRFK
jgi:hypothetical protein